MQMTSTTQPPFPPAGQYIASVRKTAKVATQNANILVGVVTSERCSFLMKYYVTQISTESIKRLLFSPTFTSSFERLKVAHGMALPLNFPSVASELNLLSLLSLMNFASGYRVPLHEATGRGAFDTIRAFIFSLYITSSVGSEDDLLSARGMQKITEGKVADLMGVADKVHIEKPHPDIPGVKVGELAGPVWELVQIVTRVLKETGTVLVNGGYFDLGSFVAEALKEGEKAKSKGEGVDPECDVIVERVGTPIWLISALTLIYLRVARQSTPCFPRHGISPWAT